MSDAPAAMKRITIRIPENLLSAIESQAATERHSVSNIIRHHLTQAYGSLTPKLDEKENPKLKGL